MNRTILLLTIIVLSGCTDHEQVFTDSTESALATQLSLFELKSSEAEKACDRNAPLSFPSDDPEVLELLHEANCGNANVAFNDALASFSKVSDAVEACTPKDGDWKQANACFETLNK